MADLDLDLILALLRDPNSESRQIAELVGCAREEAGRASRLVIGIARTRVEDVATLPGPLAAAAARAAMGAARADLLVALASHPSRDAAKEARRGIHLLRARGIDVAEPPRTSGPSAPPLARSEPPPQAYVSAIDGQGERGVWLPRILSGRGIEIAQAVISDERGLMELQLGVVGRKEWRVFARGLIDRGASMGVAEIEPSLALAMIAEARRVNERSGQRVPAGADHWLGLQGPAPSLPTV